MKGFSVVLSLFLAVAVVVAFSVPATAADHNYIGVKGCKMCHNAPDKGAQFKAWEASKHAKAYATLASPQAKEVGKAKGIANPQEAKECLKCHVTGYGLDASRFEATYTKEEGISCESCHGAGKDYKQVNIMKDLAKAKEAGLIIPDEKTCTKCHNSESPTFKSFNYQEMHKKIAHPNPQKAKK
ncbi:cytochrome c family protein [Candidatus Poribacteria bacterium]|nr:cytochrome c family protein [Candidatus Poribacteria bacterium]